MRHRNRIHVPGGTYYTVRRCKPPHLIFAQCAEYPAFEEHLSLVLAATGAKLLGYCWMPDAIHLALRIGRRPVSDLMRRVTRYCIRRMREHSGERLNPFCSGFPIILVDPHAHLLELIQYLHFLPVLAGAADTPEDYPHTSYEAYLGARQRVRVHSKDLLADLKSQGQATDVDTLTARLANAPSNSAYARFEQCQRLTPPVLGDSAFISLLPRRIRERFTDHDTPLSLDQVVAFVTASQGLSREDLLSPRRQHELVVARARIAWLASELGVASLSETARCLGRDVSSLGRAMSRHRRIVPELFTREAFAGLYRADAAAPRKKSEPGHTPAQSEQAINTVRPAIVQSHTTSFQHKIFRRAPDW